MLRGVREGAAAIKISRLCILHYLAGSLSSELRSSREGGGGEGGREPGLLPLVAFRWRSERRRQWLASLSAAGPRCWLSGCRTGDGPEVCGGEKRVGFFSLPGAPSTSSTSTLTPSPSRRERATSEHLRLDIAGERESVAGVGALRAVSLTRSRCSCDCRGMNQLELEDL
ncbi:hypothetical protein AMECASPLE_011901 [Ameca splendens]|uniref:Uncharacterized protein n=1 Tax=Ameca splendens TaxID=208324 RepID=A0ABV0Y0V5_9TELE